MVGQVARVSTWQYDVDIDYIKSIGGVAKCFNPKARSGTPDIGAYRPGHGDHRDAGKLRRPAHHGRGRRGGGRPGGAGRGGAGGTIGAGGSGGSTRGGGHGRRAGGAGTAGAAGKGGGAAGAGGGAAGTAGAASTGQAGAEEPPRGRPVGPRARVVARARPAAPWVAPARRASPEPARRERREPGRNRERRRGRQATAGRGRAGRLRLPGVSAARRLTRARGARVPGDRRGSPPAQEAWPEAQDATPPEELRTHRPVGDGC